MKMEAPEEEKGDVGRGSTRRDANNVTTRYRKLKRNTETDTRGRGRRD